jgi:hypothetical protein
MSPEEEKYRWFLVLCLIFSAAWFLHDSSRSGLMNFYRKILGIRLPAFAVAIAVLAVAIAAGYLLHDGRGSAEGIHSA